MTKKIIMMNSIITPMMKHPLTLGSMLITQTIMLSIIISEEFYSWFSYILFITIIGGMMVMFMYMSSIASNEKFKKNSIIPMIMLLSMTTMLMMEKDQTMTIMNKILENKMNMSEKEMKMMSKFFNLNKMTLTMIMMMTILMSMIAITNISSTFEGPLKKMYVQTHSKKYPN